MDKCQEPSVMSNSQALPNSHSFPLSSRRFGQRAEVKGQCIYHGAHALNLDWVECAPLIGVQWWEKVKDKGAVSIVRGKEDKGVECSVEKLLGAKNT